MNPDEIQRRWAEQSGAYSPEYYAYYGPNETSELLRTTLDRFVESEAAILELGCSSGRHLAHLYEHGFENVHGVEINDEALDVMADAYPELATEGTFYIDAIEDVVTTFDDDAFDAVYSVETLQHLHPDDDWVFEELARVAGELLVTAENEEAADGDGDGASDQSDGRERPADGDDTAVWTRTYVDDVPLYFRDWSDVFADLGMVETEVHEGKRETVRVFRSARE